MENGQNPCNPDDVARDGAKGHRQGARLPRAKEGRALLERETEGIKAERLMLPGDLVGSASQPLEWKEMRTRK